MSNPKWEKGAPPSIGWWPASKCENKTAIRWWNGKYWSAPVSHGATAETAGYWASCKEPRAIKKIQWSERWWL